ncbi:MAG: hypothetical protein MJZ74_06340 [Muribaculaceae bacterium]|nr:hypothetical protein [Muribaculaceae bacterium]
MNENDNRNKLVALLLTLLLCGVTVVVLVTSYMRYEPSSSMLDVELKQDTIMFGGEYVMLGDQIDVADGELAASDASNAEDAATANEPDVEGDDLNNSGEPTAQPPELVSSNKPSPMTVKPKDETKPKAGPSEQKPVEPKPKPEVKKSKPAETPETKPQSTQHTSANKATDNRVKNAFGNAGGTGGGKEGSVNGNSTEGVKTGRPGLNGLVGYTAERWGRPHSKWTGTVQVRVRVNTRGKVIEANVVGGSGSAYSSNEVRQSCIDESMKSQFSVPTNTTTEGVGTITWKFI